MGLALLTIIPASRRVIELQLVVFRIRSSLDGRLADRATGTHSALLYAADVGMPTLPAMFARVANHQRDDGFQRSSNSWKRCTTTCRIHREIPLDRQLIPDPIYDIIVK